MDVNSLLAYQPDTGIPGAARKRKRADPGSSQPAKLRATEEEQELVAGEDVAASHEAIAPEDIDEDIDESGLTAAERERILQMVADAPPEMEELDVSALRKMALSLERKSLKNQEQRVKHAGDPTKFMESELELHEQIHELQAIATAPSLYSELIRLKSVATLLNLLLHDNSDIVVAVIDLFQEMTDADSVEDSSEDALMLLQEVIKQDGLAMLLVAVKKLDETVREDAEGVHHAMGVLENMLEIDPSLAETLVEKSEFLDWLLNRLKSRDFDDNKQYASEILAILVQTSGNIRTAVGDLGGMDVLLRSLSLYKKSDPPSGEEIEMMENLFDILSSILQVPENRQRFVDAEGPHLMIMMIKVKTLSRFGALKVLSHAMSGPDGVQSCELFVKALGLKGLFPAFMKTPKVSHKSGHTESEFEEYVCSIIVALLKNLKNKVHRARLLKKLVESDMVKIDRLLELHFSYVEKVQQVEQKIQEEIKELQEQGEEIDEETENEQYLQRMDGGLFTLQLVDYIIGSACLAWKQQVVERVKNLFAVKGSSLDSVIDVLKEYEDNLDGEQAETDKKRVEKMLQYLTSVRD
eukprot:m.140791 g.140791  ORF g.140791 m.140791 type:complete len:582 (-) comp24123_c0_seq4:13-1758(-)